MRQTALRIKVFIISVLFILPCNAIASEKPEIFVQHVAGPEMGVGHYVFLDKVNGKWIIAGNSIGRIF